MANNNTKAGEATLTSTTQNNLIVLKPAVQRQVTALREARNLAKQAKKSGDEARDAILDAVGSLDDNAIGTDAKGKRLVSFKLIPTSESFDWERFAKEQPELHELLVKEYTTPKGAGTPTIRVDLI